MGVLLAAASVAVACSGGASHSTTSGGEIFGNRSSGAASANADPATTAPAAPAPAILKAPAGTDAATLAAAATAVRARLGRMHVPVTSVSATADGVAVVSSADPYQLEAAARPKATTIAPITGTALGPCQGAGLESVGPSLRCYTVGAPVAAVTAIANAVPATASGAGWKVNLAIDPAQYQTFRGPLERATGQGQTMALVTGDNVVLAVSAGVPALASQIGPALSEEQARRTAAALAVDDDLPVALSAPAVPPPQGARVNLDFWTAPLGVDVCGTWLANAPAAGLDTGVHSHGDGLIYIHPFTAAEAGNHATLGLFLERGKWKATQDTLDLWDGTEHHNGDACPTGGPAAVRWWVDGVEQKGDPSVFTPANGQVIVLSFNPAGVVPGTAPQEAALSLPILTAAGS
jgi:hypothetical protein